MASAKIVQLPGTMPKPEKKKRNTMPDGRKRVRATVTEPDGRKWKKPFYGRTIREAEENRDKFLAEQKQAIEIAKRPRPQTVAERADIWYNVHYCAGNPDRDARGTKLSIINKIKNSALGEMRIDDVLPTHIKEFANVCRYSKSHTSKIRATLNSIFTVSIGDRLIKDNPCEDIAWENNGEEHHRALEVWERDLVTENWHLCPAGVGGMIMMYTGERPEEARVQSLKRIADADVLVRDSSRFLLDGSMKIKVDAVKTQAGFRDVPIYAPLRDVIEYSRKRTNDIMWLSANNEILTEAAYRKNWESFLHTLRCIHFGIKPNKAGNYGGIRIDLEGDKDRAEWESTLDFVPYTLRHTFCTMLFEAGVDKETAKYYMGHKDSWITEFVYTHLTQRLKALSRDKSIAYFNDLHNSISPH